MGQDKDLYGNRKNTFASWRESKDRGFFMGTTAQQEMEAKIRNIIEKKHERRDDVAEVLEKLCNEYPPSFRRADQ